MKALHKIFILSAMFGLCVANTQAAVVNIGGTDYSITTLTGTFDEYSFILQSQIWWGDAPLAEEFASELGTALGTPNPSSLGPLFATELFNSDLNVSTRAFLPGPDVVVVAQPGTLTPNMTFATVSSVPIPAAAWLFGSALLGLGVVKRRKA